MAVFNSQLIATKNDKRKYTFEVSTTLFRNNSDHHEFQEMFRKIDESPLAKSSNVPICINKEIAEYATGKIEKCYNKHCNNDIPILAQDKVVYNGDHHNAHKIGYKWFKAYSLEAYFCSFCMNNANPCYCRDCTTLNWIPDCNQCRLCSSIIFDCECRCDCCVYWECNNCDFVTCGDCYGTAECVECANIFCDECSISYKDDPDYCICNECYDDTIIECNKCNAKCRLLFKSNNQLDDDIYLNQMKKCDYQDCNVFICFNCNEDERNGKQYSNKYGKQYFCNKHCPCISDIFI